MMEGLFICLCLIIYIRLTRPKHYYWIKYKGVWKAKRIKKRIRNERKKS